MGFLDSLTDAFTGQPAVDAAAKSRDYLTGVQTNGTNTINTALGNATGAVNAGTDAARTALGTGYTTATGAANTGSDAALGDINSGTSGALGKLDAAGAAYAPLAALGSKYGGATTLGLDALGVNGAAGTSAAQGAFTASPGYQFNMDQGLDAIDRARAASGQLASGNTDRDAQQFGAGLASNEYNTWLNNLLGFTNPELSATSGAASGTAGVDTNAANLLSTAGAAKAGIDTSRASMLASLGSQYGSNLAGLESGAGNTIAGLDTGAAGQQVGLDTAIAPAYSKTYSDAAAAQMQGSANLWNLGQNVAKLGVNAIGGLGTGSSNVMGWAPNPNGGGISPMY